IQRNKRLVIGDEDNPSFERCFHATPFWSLSAISQAAGKSLPSTTSQTRDVPMGREDTLNGSDYPEPHRAIAFTQCVEGPDNDTPTLWLTYPRRQRGADSADPQSLGR